MKNKTFTEFIADNNNASVKWAEEYLKYALFDMNYHFGDCTQEANSCALCYVEEMLEDYAKYALHPSPKTAD